MGGFSMLARAQSVLSLRWMGTAVTEKAVVIITGSENLDSAPF